MTTARTPFAIDASRASVASAAGTAISANSTGSSTDAKSGYAGTPCTVSRFGLIG
jgi:hypothetical protein